MIELYQLHWSHYVEKVIWALDYKQLPWRGIDINPFTKQEMMHLDARHQLNDSLKGYTVPTIHDRNFDTTVADSTPILEYLDTQYPDTPPLIRGRHQARIRQWLIWLDSELGTLARRLGYTQIVLEQPSILSRLFLRRTFGGVFTWPVMAGVSGRVLASMLSQRFGIASNRKDGAYERAFAMLQSLAAYMKQRSFVFSGGFSAADIALAALLRPMRIVSLFRSHQSLRSLFEWQAELFARHGRDREYPYETELHKTRQARGWSLGRIKWLPEVELAAVDPQVHLPPAAEGKSRNDHQPVKRSRLLLAPLDYLHLRHGAGAQKTRYA